MSYIDDELYDVKRIDGSISLWMLIGGALEREARISGNLTFVQFSELPQAGNQWIVYIDTASGV